MGAGFSHDQLQAFGTVEEVGEAEAAMAFQGAAVAKRQQARQPSVGGAIPGIGKNIRRAVLENEPCPDHHAKIRVGRNSFLGETIGAHHARQGVAIRDAEAGEPQPMGLGHQFFRMGGAPQEREVGGHRQFGKTGHRLEPLVPGGSGDPETPECI